MRRREGCAVSSLEWTENRGLFPSPLLGMTSLSLRGFGTVSMLSMYLLSCIYCPCGCVFIHHSIAWVTSVTVKALLFCQDSRAVTVMSAIIHLLWLFGLRNSRHHGDILIIMKKKIKSSFLMSWQLAQVERYCIVDS